MGKTSAGAAAGIVLDAGALIGLLQRALLQGRVFRLPAGVVGQVWRNGRVQVTLSRFLRSEGVEIVPLDEPLARACSGRRTILSTALWLCWRARGGLRRRLRCRCTVEGVHLPDLARISPCA